MQHSFGPASLFGAALLAAISACAEPDLTPLCSVPPGATPSQALTVKQACYGATQRKIVDPRSFRDVDILFVIDNSPSMTPKQNALAVAIPQFIRAIDAMGTNYHVGVTTTDLGYNPTATTGTTPPWNTISACNTVSGDNGVLQNIPCTNRAGLGGEAAAACATLCPDPRYVPAGGGRFISKHDGITNVPVFNQDGVDVGPQKAFQCLALVGDIGCRVTQPLEAAKRAVDNQRTDNGGFPRETSVLAVIFITDQDDRSVELLQRGLLEPRTLAAGTPSCNTATPTPGVDPQCFNLDYRSLATDLACDQPMNTPGAKTNCRERPDTFLTPIDQYVNFFASLPNPTVVIAGIWTPTLLDNPAAQPAKDGQLYVDFGTGTLDSTTLTLGQKTRAGCYNPDPTLTADPSGFWGQAQLRLSSFIRRFQGQNVSESSICDPNGYAKYLSKINFTP